jgi:hypothetical protein
MLPAVRRITTERGNNGRSVLAEDIASPRCSLIQRDKRGRPVLRQVRSASRSD